MEETSTGSLVPTVKSEPPPESSQPPLTAEEVEAENLVETAAEVVDVSDRDCLCPICMQIIKDAFLTACGHSYCYMCIATHLRNKNDCPCCGHHITPNQIFPNFLLNKLLKKTCAHQITKNASSTERFRQALDQGYEVSGKELDSLLSLLSEQKRKMEQEDAEKNMQILLDFLQRLKKQKLEEFHEVKADLQYIKEDINAVERHRIELSRATPLKPKTLADNPTSRPLPIGKLNSGLIPNAHDLQDWMNSSDMQRRKSYTGSDSQQVIQSASTIARKRQINAQFNDLQECYLQKRRHSARQAHKQHKRDTNTLTKEGYHEGLEDFQSVLTNFSRYSRLRVIAELRHTDLFHSANIVSSIEFNRDDQLFATAGVSRSIKVFEFSSIVNEPTEVHCPIVEMSTLSKLSCLSWNKHTKNHIASSDYEGIVTVWDITTRQSVMEYEEHEKRAWSVDFSSTDPSMLVSGSDDCKVKVWSTKQEASALNIDMKANICSVKYNPGSSLYVAVGSADHHIHYYDLRNISKPLHVFSGHRKAVSYVKFMSNTELASASTDSTLRLWDVKENLPLRTFRGHTNEKNFVGLTANSEFVACGSETNDVFVYNKAISKPMAWHRFSSSNTQDTEEEAGSHFISAVCWKSDSPTVLTANSQGTIKVLVLAA